MINELLSIFLLMFIGPVLGIIVFVALTCVVAVLTLIHERAADYGIAVAAAVGITIASGALIKALILFFGLLR